MRRGSNTGTWRTDDNKVIAFNLGADYCAEHEWGIKKMKANLGIDAPNYSRIFQDLNQQKAFLKQKKHKVGIATRTVTDHRNITDNLDTAGVMVDKNGPLWGVALKQDWRSDMSFDFGNLRDLYWNPEREKFLSWWCEDDFAILSPDKQDIRDLKEAFEKNDVAVWLGGSGPFKNAGLVITILSRLPKSFLEDALIVDQEYIELLQAAFKTEIYKKLDKAGCTFMALSPKWKDDKKAELIFWLNPQDQRNINYGWYSLSDLEAWAKGTGPIIKNVQKVI